MTKLHLIVAISAVTVACGVDQSPVEHSGSRLKLMYASDPAREAEGILDTDLPAECTFQRESLHSYACVPDGGAPSELLVHATDEWQPAQTNIVPTFLVADDGLVVHHGFHDIAGDFDCAFDASGTCQPTD